MPNSKILNRQASTFFMLSRIAPYMIAGILLTTHLPAVMGQDGGEQLPDSRTPRGPTDQQVGPAYLEEYLSHDQVSETFDALAKVMRERWLIFYQAPFDLDSAIAAELHNAENGLKRYELELAIQRLIARGCDGHAISGGYIQALSHSSGRCRLSFYIVPVGDKFVANKSHWQQRSQLWKEDYPHITAIDGVPIERWIEQAEQYVSRTNPLAQRSMAALQVGFLGHFRKELGLPANDRIQVSLQTKDLAEETISIPFPDTAADPFLPQLAYSTYRLSEKKIQGIADWRILDGNIGYLHIPTAGSRAMQTISDGMPAMKNTRGLIIDLRCNSGGSPEYAMFLQQWLVSPGSPRSIGGFQWTVRESSTNFPMYGITERGLSDAARTMLSDAQSRLKDKWQPPPHFNAALHFGLLTNWKDEPGIAPYNRPEIQQLFEKHNIEHYQQRVMILVDRYTFSAGEIGAAWLQALPNVTVMGESTRGAVSAANDESFAPFTIPHVLKPHLRTQTAFLDHNGNHIEGRGVTPDIHHGIDLETITGPEDTMVEHARKCLLPK